MNTKDLATITTVALGTAALTVAIFLGNTIEADNEGITPTPTIAKPELVANGVKMTVAASADAELAAGKTPAFDLHAVNTLDKSAELCVRLTMTAVAPTSVFSRMIAMPQELWHEERAITLAPNETKTFVFNASTNLPANKLFSISMLVVDPSKALPDANSPVTGANAKLRPLSISHFGIAGLNFSTVPQGKGLASAPTQSLPQ